MVAAGTRDKNSAKVSKDCVRKKSNILTRQSAEFTFRISNVNITGATKCDTQEMNFIRIAVKKYDTFYQI